MLPGLTGRLCLRGDGRAASQGGMEAMQTNRGVGSLATHPAAAKHFEEVGAASITMFLWVLVQAPPSRRAGLKPSIGYRQEPPAPEPVLIQEQKITAMREDAGWCPDGHVRRRQRKSLGGGPHKVWDTGNA